MPSDLDKLLVETERVRSVFQQAPVTLLVTVINTILTASVLAPDVDRGLLVTWTALIVVVSAVGWAVRRRFLHRRPEGAQCRPWAMFTVCGSLATGLLWGIGLTALFPASETSQLFLAFVVGGMCAGTTTVNSAHMPSVLAFILPASLPLAANFLVAGSGSQAVPASMIVIFASALSVTSFRAHRAFGERIRLQLALARQQRELSEANERLRNEVAERRTVEATLHQAQKMEAIGHLTGGIAHDFNNLLQVMIGNLNLIRRSTGGNPRILRYALAAEQAAERGARLTGSLLAFARRQSLRAERVNIDALLQEFKPILLRALSETIRFEVVLDKHLPDCLVDPAHFQSAILNLVINARDAMVQGGQLSITTSVVTLAVEDLLGNPGARPGRFVSVAVQDSGSGMSEEILARAFEPFFTTKEIGKGSGLGLSQVYGFVHQSGGHVRLRSKPGTGTCVTLCLPVADEGTDVREVHEEAKESPVTFFGATALVVEDDPDVLEVIAVSLSETGCRVQAAQTGRQALEILLRGDDVQFLLTDVALQGGQSGVEIAWKARALRPGLPIILTTGHAEATLAAKGVVEGEFRLLRKPFQASELLAQIGEAWNTGTGTRCRQSPGV